MRGSHRGRPMSTQMCKDEYQGRDVLENLVEKSLILGSVTYYRRVYEFPPTDTKGVPLALRDLGQRPHVAWTRQTSQCEETDVPQLKRNDCGGAKLQQQGSLLLRAS